MASKVVFTPQGKRTDKDDLKSMSQRSDGEFSNPFCGTILPSQLLCIGSASQITELIIECGKKGEFDADRHIGVILYIQFTALPLLNVTWLYLVRLYNSQEGWGT